MVNELSPAARAERDLALGYAPARARAAITALWALDDRLRAIAAAARDPLIGLMRLTWWREALERLDAAPAPAEPVLRALAAEVLPMGVSGAAMAALVDGWDRVVEDDTDWLAVAMERGGRLFALAAVLLGEAEVRIEAVGAGWAATDLARTWPAAAGATPVPIGAYRKPWPRALRPLGALGLLARFDAVGEVSPGHPRRIARLLAHRLTGR